jgi:VIT1/CCC1 family predicted Fe2+/Mn2+ transporter
VSDSNPSVPASAPASRVDELAVLRAEHTRAAIRARLAAGPEKSDLRDFVYGAVDGTVTTFAVVSGVAGAGLDHGIIVVLGLANVLADGFSMAAGNYLGTRAEAQRHARARRVERRHIEEVPDGEREEIRQIFAAKGFAGAELDAVVRVITDDVERWVETMVREEHGISSVPPAPRRAAWITFISFVAIGLVPLLPFLAATLGSPIERPYLWSALGTALAFFAVGAAKGRVVDHPPLRSGLETLLIGGAAAALSYVVGYLLRGRA